MPRACQDARACRSIPWWLEQPDERNPHANARASTRTGVIVIFDRTGKASWRYRPTGAAQLNKPSLALPLPNGDVFATDDANNRIIVVDPRTNRVVWQYGHKSTPGKAPGYLANPDGMDLLPPNALWPITQP